MKDKMIVITGAAGFIGSAVVRHLNDQGLTNLLLVDDIKRTQKWKNLLNKRFTDFISKHALFEWLQGRQHEISAFIHLGACSDTLEMDGDYLMENNYRYTVKLAEYALKHGHRFIYASSAATYGNGMLGFSDHHDLLDELQPLNLYGYSKHLFDMWAKQHRVLDKVTGLKYFNVFGPNENHKGRMSSFVYQKYPTACESQPLKLFKSTEPERFPDGGQQRDFIYVKDVAKMTCDFLTNNHTGIYNIGSGEATTWNHLAKSLYKALEKPAQIEYLDMPTDLAKQYQNYTCADMTKYCKTHGLATPVPTLQFNVEDGVLDYVQNHLLKAERW